MFDPKWCIVQDNEVHIKEILRWLIKEVYSASGDGDAIWYSKYYKIEDIKQLLIDVLKELDSNWKVVIDEYGLQAGIDQEGLIITNNENVWNNRPEWQQCSLCW